MKRIILTVMALLLITCGWAQSIGKLSGCNIQIKHQATPPSCFNGMDGKIALQISGAKKSYTVQWSDGGEGDVRNALVGGSYIATVRDAEGCVTKYELTLPQGQILKGDLSIKQQSSAPGKIYLNVTFANGSKPMAVKIKNLTKGISSPWIDYKGEILGEGVYMVEAFTKEGCSQISKIDLRTNTSKQN